MKPRLARLTGMATILILALPNPSFTSVDYEDEKKVAATPATLVEPAQPLVQPVASSSDESKDPESFVGEENLKSSSRTEGDSESVPSPEDARSLISYKTLVSWFLDRVGPSSRDAGESTITPTPSSSIDSSEEVADKPIEGEETLAAVPESTSEANSTEDSAATGGNAGCTTIRCVLKIGQKPKGPFKCTPRNMTTLEAKREGATMDDLKKVHLFSSETRVHDAILRRKPEQGDCLLLLAFSPHCRFSANLAPLVNALPRAFPLLEVGAFDARFHRGLSHRFGVVGVPSLLLFKNNKLVAKLNDSDGLVAEWKDIVETVKSTTGLRPDETVVVEDADLVGPLKTVAEEETDVYLVLSWIFLVVFAAQRALRSGWGRSLCQSLLLHWRAAQEAAEEGEERHHPHAE